MGRILLPFLIAPLLAITLFVFEIDGSLLDSGFYKERLRDANAYSFLLNDVATAAVEDARRLPPPAGMTENALDATGLSTAQIVNSLNRAIPPVWLRAQTERAIDQIAAYAVKDSNRIAIRVNVSERVPQIISETGVLVENADVHDILYDALIAPETDLLHEAVTASGLQVERARLERSVAAVFTEEWTSQQVAALYYEAAPYFAGQTDSFEARVRLDGLRSPLIDELRVIVRELDWRLILSTHLIEPMVRRGENQSVRLIQGLDLPRSEVIAILGDSVTRQQYEAAADDAVDELAAYMFGDTENPTVSIDLTDVKRQSRPRLVDLAKRTANERVNALPPCAAGENWLPPASAFARSAFPTCYPAEPQARNALQQTLSKFDADADAHVEDSIVALMPDTLTFTEANFWMAMRYGGATLGKESVAQLREILTDGVPFTSDDLKAVLESEFGPSAVQSVEDARSFFRDGIVITHTDLMSVLPAADVETWRSRLAARSSAKWLPPAFAAALLMFFAALIRPGRRIMWSAGLMAFIFAFCFIIFGPLYRFALEPQLGSYLACDPAMFIPPLPREFAYSAILMCGKLREIALDSANAVMNGLALKAAIGAAAFGLLALAAAMRLARAGPRHPA